LLILFWDGKTSRLIVFILALNPVHINISHNAFYDSILLCILFFSLEKLFRYFREQRLPLLILSGASASLLAFIHATGYIYIFLIWLCFLIFRRRIRPVEVVTISLAIGLLPFLQVLAWKHYTGSIFPYQKLQSNFLFLEALQVSGYQLRHYLRYVIYLVINYSPLLFLSVFVFLFDLRWKKDAVKIMALFSVLALIVVLRFTLLSPDVVSPLVFIWGIVFVTVLKSDLIEKNRLVFVFGLMGLSVFILYLRIFPSTGFGPRQFIYPVVFFLPVFWHNGERWIKKSGLLAACILTGYVLLFIPAFYFNLPQHKGDAPPGLKVTYAQVLSPALPYYERAEKYKLALKWLKAFGISTSDRIFSNISNRWLNANLNLSQNHYLKSSEVYDQSEGFGRQTLDDIDALMQSHQPRFVIWDLEQHHQEYNLVLRDGRKKIDYSPEQFLQRLGERYQEITVIGGEILVLERI
jgi:hypothetical protein